MTQKVWFVTGASAGLGRAMTERILQEGDKVAATLRKPSDIANLQEKYPATQLLVLKLDVVSLPDIQAAFAQAVEAFGRIDVVYNNAGIAALGEVEGTPDDMARKIFDVNFFGAANVSREAIRIMRDVNKPQGGRLLQVSSYCGVFATPGMGFYSASKHALEGLSQSLTQELNPSWNIKITLLEFGAFRTRALLPDGLPILPIHQAYTEAPTAAIRQFFDDGSATASTADTNKAVREVYKIAFDESVGLRVPIGLDALDRTAVQLEQMKKDYQGAEKWSTDLQFDA